ncbi:MAG: Holliday junction resolvase RuvX [Candidatus Hydrogenedentes bacterium]|nr:Holliday junction resolvase RuvX [Candidatus Hydrogenedentota bacterium]
MNEPGALVGLDVGEVRIGVAVSDPLGILASPHSVIPATDRKEALEAIQEVVKEREAVGVVAGLPLDQNGEVGPQAKKILDFLDALREVVGVEVMTQDERFTTAAAERMLIQANMSRRARKKVIDKIAAQHILQLYLDRRKNTGG